jgi:hypothetical protein
MDLVLSILRCALGMLAVTAASVHSAGRPNRDYSFFSAEHPLPIEGSKRCWRGGRWSWTHAVMSCVTPARWSRSPSVGRCSRSHARSARRGPETRRGTYSLRGHSERSAPMNRVARGCGSKSGGFTGSGGGVSATKRGFALAPRRPGEVVVLARPGVGEHVHI